MSQYIEFLFAVFLTALTIAIVAGVGFLLLGMFYGIADWMKERR